MEDDDNQLDVMMAQVSCCMHENHQLMLSALLHTFTQALCPWHAELAVGQQAQEGRRCPLLRAFVSQLLDKLQEGGYGRCL